MCLPEPRVLDLGTLVERDLVVEPRALLEPRFVADEPLGLLGEVSEEPNISESDIAWDPTALAAR